MPSNAIIKTNAENDLAAMVEDIAEATNLLKVKEKIRTSIYIFYMLDALDNASTYITETRADNIHQCLNVLNWKIKEYD